jgi:hypothetical protein
MLAGRQYGGKKRAPTTAMSNGTSLSTPQQRAGGARPNVTSPFHAFFDQPDDANADSCWSVAKRVSSSAFPLRLVTGIWSSARAVIERRADSARMRAMLRGKLAVRAGSGQEPKEWPISRAWCAVKRNLEEGGRLLSSNLAPSGFCLRQIWGRVRWITVSTWKPDEGTLASHSDLVLVPPTFHYN